MHCSGAAQPVQKLTQQRNVVTSIRFASINLQNINLPELHRHLATHKSVETRANRDSGSLLQVGQQEEVQDQDTRNPLFEARHHTWPELSAHHVTTQIFGCMSYIHQHYTGLSLLLNYQSQYRCTKGASDSLRADW